MDIDSLFNSDSEVSLVHGITANCIICWVLQRGRAKAWYAHLVTLEQTDKIKQGELLILPETFELTQSSVIASEKVADPKVWIADRMIMKTHILKDGIVKEVTL